MHPQKVVTSADAQKMKAFKDMTAADFTDHIYLNEEKPLNNEKKFISFFRVVHSDVEIPEEEITEGVVTDALLAVPNVARKR